MRITRDIEETWRRYDAVEARLTAPVSERMLDLAQVGPGMRVLDIATGRGEPALRAARRVGPDGYVLGIDPSGAMLGLARDVAEREGLAWFATRVGSGEDLRHVSLPPFDAVTARWGLMYMDAPVDALVNAARLLSDEGALVAALWAEPERVPYATLPRQLLERYRRFPAIDPEAPGTFRYGHLERIQRDFHQAGLAVDHVEEMAVAVFEAASHQELIEWVSALGMGELLRELSAADQRAWEADLVAAVPRARSDGKVRLGGVTRIVRARRSREAGPPTVPGGSLRSPGA